ncbi:MAG: SIMPL domain-containing protein [Bauldia sp.]|nr:SIMPL domain-containing protein [Bauldia sp.]
MKRLLVLIGLVIVAAAPAAAQERFDIPTLTANGSGVAYGTPDIVTINIGVTSRAEKPADALAANSRDMEAVIAAIRGAGVDEADIATSGFSINPVYRDDYSSREAQGPQVVAYEVTNQLTVRIRDIASSGAVLNLVVEAGANQINGISFDIDEPQALQDEALRLAIAEARRTAEVMAEAAGVTLGEVVSVSAFADAQPMFESRAYAMNQAVPIVGGERSITASATVVFAIVSE